MVNKVMLIGNLGQDPEVRTTGGGTAVANLRIATSSRRKDDTGNWTDHTEWHTVVCFGKTAENCGRFLSKGRQIFIEGRLQTRKWQDRDGNDKWSTEVVAHEVKFLGGRPEGTNSYSGNEGSSYTSKSGYGGSTSEGTGAAAASKPDDEIPF